MNIEKTAVDHVENWIDQELAGLLNHFRGIDLIPYCSPMQCAGAGRRPIECGEPEVAAG